MTNKAKWITNKDFSNLKPDLKIFHKELEPYKPEYNEKLWNSHILFRKKFNISKKIDSFSIQISADDYYLLYINGNFICSGPSPAYPWHYYYNKIDITQYITQGENIIAVHTYYQGLINRVWVSGDNQHGMICEIYNNDKVILSSDTDFKCKKHSMYDVYDIGVKRHDTIFNELIRSDSKTIGFEKIDFDDSDWDNCCVRQYQDYNLFYQDSPMLTYSKIKPDVMRFEENYLYIDIGYEIIGYLNIRAKGIKGDVVTIEYAEELDDNEMPRYELRCVCTYLDKWILSGNTDEFRAFDYKGFRYAKINFPNGEFKIDDVYITVRHCEYKESAVCNINDPTVLKVWELCKNTLKYGAQECFIDCPTREKGQYLGDVCISSVAFSILTGDTKMLKKSLIDFKASSKICTGLMAVSTSSFMQEIADYSLLYPFILLWYYKLSGDKTLLNDTLDVTENMIAYFRKHERNDGLIVNVREKWNLVDWPANLRDNYDVVIEKPMNDTCHNVINAIYIGAVKCLNEIYKILGKSTIDISKAEESFVKEFYNQKTGLFCDSALTDHSALHSNVLPLLFNIGINDRNKAAIVKLIEEKGVATCGTYFAYFVLQSLKNIKEYDLVIKLIKDDKAWMNMISEGATTTYEAWGKDQKKNTSLFHPWSTCPIIILYDM